LCLKFINFRFAYSPPLGDFQKAFETGGEFQILRMLLEIIFYTFGYLQKNLKRFY
jgi:hypothetical protein